MRISDWSSDVCSSDLHTPLAVPIRSAREFRTMLDRRSIIAGGTASFLCAAGLRAQVLPPQGFATPSGTVPFAPDVFRERRRRVMEALKDGVAVVPGAGPVESGAGGAPPFVQDGAFAWLTGIVDEPGAVLVMAPAERTVREWLVLPSRDVESERWEVERLPLGTELERRTGRSEARRVGTECVRTCRSRRSPYH